jgi:hypothetical protein
MARSWATIALSAAGLAALAPGADAFAASSPATVALRRSNAVCNVAMEAAPRMDRRAVFPLAAAGLGAVLFPGSVFAAEPIPMDKGDLAVLPPRRTCGEHLPEGGSREKPFPPPLQDPADEGANLHLTQAGLWLSSRV